MQQGVPYCHIEQRKGLEKVNLNVNLLKNERMNGMKQRPPFYLNYPTQIENWITSGKSLDQRIWTSAAKNWKPIKSFHCPKSVVKDSDGFYAYHWGANGSHWHLGQIQRPVINCGLVMNFKHDRNDEHCSSINTYGCGYSLLLYSDLVH